MQPVAPKNPFETRVEARKAMASGRAPPRSVRLERPQRSGQGVPGLAVDL